ncbi:MAG TPA: hypothetical protein VMR49_02860 [Candidatus Paceibacterota bacterium]|jgi:hypothetical protein|nr:hypothetical protein [Candidatus Paceibacterota bacterium]
MKRIMFFAFVLLLPVSTVKVDAQDEKIEKIFDMNYFEIKDSLLKLDGHNAIKIDTIDDDIIILTEDKTNFSVHYLFYQDYLFHKYWCYAFFLKPKNEIGEKELLSNNFLKKTKDPDFGIVFYNRKRLSEFPFSFPF